MGATPARSIDRVTNVVRYGPDQQVDDKALIIPPGEWDATDPFLLMAEDWFSSTGFEWHPHRGIETVTFVLDGEIEHTYNAGGHGVLGAGDVQWMTAGRGIIHREVAHQRNPVHTLQLWLNLPAAEKMTTPSYQDLHAADMPSYEVPGVRVTVFAGETNGAHTTTERHVPATVLTIDLDAGATFDPHVPSGDRLFVYVVEGQARIGGNNTEVAAGQVAWSDPTEGATPSRLTIHATEPVRAVLASGPPLHEPVVAAGPFVMNTRDQVMQAYEDFRTGEFGRVPAGM
jgi:quercetin 2,3-dioxygenase